MDTWTLQQQKGQQVDVNATLQIIKTNMPSTYQAIKDKAEDMGNDVYAYVRRGIKGEPNCFYAIEGGYVVGHPFDSTDAIRDIAQYMVMFGCRHLIMWSPYLVTPKGGKDGTN